MPYLDHDQLGQVVANAEARLAALREKYPKLKAYLVFFLRGSQVGIRSSGGEILGTIPGMVDDNPAKAALQKHHNEKPEKDVKDSTKEAWNERLKVLEKNLSYIPEARVELRFPNLDFEIIDSLRTDQLINKKLTPQTRASIRIVLGTIEELSRG